jgi:hypothetical protein
MHMMMVGSRTQQTRKNPILSVVNLAVGDANNPGTLGKVAPPIYIENA